jgi:hypothetical protein
MYDGVNGCSYVSKQTARRAAICAANTVDGKICVNLDTCDGDSVDTIRAPHICGPYPTPSRDPVYRLWTRRLVDMIRSGLQTSGQLRHTIAKV